MLCNLLAMDTVTVITASGEATTEKKWAVSIVTPMEGHALFG